MEILIQFKSVTLKDFCPIFFFKSYPIIRFLRPVLFLPASGLPTFFLSYLHPFLPSFSSASILPPSFSLSSLPFLRLPVPCLRLKYYRYIPGITEPGKKMAVLGVRRRFPDVRECAGSGRLDLWVRDIVTDNMLIFEWISTHIYTYIHAYNHGYL